MATVSAMTGTSGPTGEQPAAILCDMDGVVWLANRPLPRAAQAVQRLRSAGHRVVFVTNNSYATVGSQEELLAGIGIPAVGDVLTSAMAAATLVEPDSRVLVCGGPGLVESVRGVGAETLDTSAISVPGVSVDAVVVGFHTTFDYPSLRVAATAIRGGARFIASNEDATYPTPEGPIPGGGSIVAAVATASGRRPEVAGKPHEAMAALVRRHVTGVGELSVMIGDRPSTDGRFARTLGCRFALVRSAISADETGDSGGLEVDRDFEGSSLWDVAHLIVGSHEGMA